MDYIEFSNQMIKNSVKDKNGNIICSFELWEQIANIVNEFGNEIEKIFEDIDNLQSSYSSFYNIIEIKQYEKIKEKYGVKK